MMAGESHVNLKGFSKKLSQAHCSFSFTMLEARMENDELLCHVRTTDTFQNNSLLVL